MKVDATIMPTATISGFVTSDTIDLAAVSFDSNGSATLGAGNVLAVTAGGQTYDLNFDPSQDFVGYGFQLSSDGSVGTDVTLVVQPLTSSATIPAGQTAYDVSVGSSGVLVDSGTLLGASTCY